ncbi:hypothetical protein GCM10028791_08480 [Echinicola sediminis]
MDVASARGLNLNKIEFWRNQYFLGLDQENHHLVYSGDISSGSPLLIDLREVRNVQLHEESRTLHHHGEKNKVIDRLELILNGEIPGKRWVLEVFDGERFSDLAGEPVLIKVWKEHIENAIKKPIILKANA